MKNFKIDADYYKDNEYQGKVLLNVEKQEIDKILNAPIYVTYKMTEYQISILEEFGSLRSKEIMSEMIDICSNINLKYKHDITFKNKFLEIDLYQSFITSIEECENHHKCTFSQSFQKVNLNENLEKYLIRLERKRKLKIIRNGI